jgi:predicted nucleotidyltransferase
VSSPLQLSSADLEVLQALAQNDVRVVVIGGHAVRFYGVNREPEDLDLLVDATMKGGSNLVAALRSLGAYVDRYPVAHFAEAKKQIPIKFNGRNVELLTSLPDLPFDEVFDAASVVEVGALKVRVISKSHLIKAKRSAGRPADTRDLRDLERSDHSKA